MTIKEQIALIDVLLLLSRRFDAATSGAERDDIVTAMKVVEGMLPHLYGKPEKTPSGA